MAGWLETFTTERDVIEAAPPTTDYSTARLRQVVLELERALDGAPQPPSPFDDAPHPGESGSEPESGARYRLTELGNAERFADLCVSSLRFVYAWKLWLVWDGKRWRRDASGAEDRAAKRMIELLFEQANNSRRVAEALSAQHGEVIATASSSDRSADAKQLREKARNSAEYRRTKEAEVDAATMARWASQSSTAKVIGATVKLARSDARLVATPCDFDVDGWVLNVQNGTLDLRTGVLRPHRQADMITKLAAVNYDPDASAPRWERFLEQIHPDAEMRAWLQRFVGYCLTGEMSEQIMLFALGIGNNGKNVLFETLLALLGDYAMVAAPDLLVLKHNDEHPTGFADLQGHRLVVVSEIDHGRKWAEATIKRLTGDKTFKARRMQQDFYEFSVTFKFAVMSNTKPEVRGTDNGIWRRILLAPFDVSISERDRDPGLLGKLLEEREGILAWAVRGCAAWQRDGLGVPKLISDAVATYRREQDVVGEWIAERCVCVCLPAGKHWKDDGFCGACGASVPDQVTRAVPDNGSREPWGTIYPDFRGWLDARGGRPWSLAAFRSELVKRPWLSAYRTNTERGVEGLQLRYQAPQGWPGRPDRFADRDR